VISALMRQSPDQAVVAWLDEQPRDSIWVTSITVLEVRFGLEVMPAGRKRAALLRRFDSLLDAIGGRIAAFDAEAAEHAGSLMARRQREGRPVELRDTMIAGIMLARHSILATRNTTHFQDAGISLVNPWSE
jgi:hypothetical protein